MSPEGTFIRGAAESWDQAWMSRKQGIDAIKDRSYPGFVHAFNNSFKTPIGGTGVSRPIVGTKYYEVVTLQRVGDHFIADVCSYGSQVASETDDGKYTSGGPNRYLTGGNSFVFGPDPTLRPEQQHSPSAHQQGPANRPTDNVFGTWVLTESGVRKGMDDATQHEFLTRCNKPALGTLDNLPNPYIRVDPPPTLPPDPGWPDAGNA
ncbi:hypothetical protein DDT48_13945 [Mycobacteroides abscessus]|nr:hypothetical protein DDT48_13945 [Mycobacteroides abscessus]EIC62463.1 hypothetical protein S7W_23866 [Mycobacteroides abscessus M94]PVB37655.1 hypothetical protein DDJ39_18245 [Mycobacteroides abscessus]RIT05513.1 hypothetical protein D2E74_13955 [Mycobacteroides abscessus]RIT96280.1 hypothetical protein D2F00_10360 [Mycobacteroides abscessus]